MGALLKRGDGVSFGRSNRVINGATIDILDDDGNRIGYVDSYSWDTARKVESVRHLSSEDAGRIIELVPGVEDFSLTVTGYSLYDKSLTERGSLINRMGSATAALRTLSGQRESFHMVVKQKHPTTGEVSVRRFFDCWITSYGESRSIGRAATTDTAKILVGQVE